LAGNEVGYYTLPVILSFQGVDRQVNSKLGKTFSIAGTKAGKDFGKNMAAGLNASKDVEKATERKAKAVDKLATATSKVRQAEAALQKQESLGNITGRAQALERVTQARVSEAAAVRQVTSATNQLQSATKEVQQQAQNAGGSGGGAGGTGTMGLMLFGRGGVSALTSMSGTAGTAAGVAMKAGVAGALTAAAGAAIAAPFFAAFKAFNWGAEVGLPLERTMNTLAGVTRASGTEMAAAGAEARRLGSDTKLAGVTASDAAAAMTELAKGGLTVKEAMEAARGTVQLAVAGELDAAEAAKIQSGAMNTFGLAAGDATRVADLLAASANASAASVSDLGSALTQGGAVASGFGVSIEDTLTALTMFSRMGINGSDAGTMLKTSLQAITDQSNPAQGAIEQLGLTLYDAQGQFVGVESMLKQVAEASGRMSEEQFQAATNVLFGSDAMRASMVATRGGAQAWDDAARDITKGGEAAAMAEAQMKGMPGVIEGASNTIDGMKLAVYDAGHAMAVALGGEALGGLTGLADWITAHQPQIIGFFTMIGTEAVAGMAQLASAVETGADVLATLVNVVGDTLGGMTRAQAAVNRLLGRGEAADELDAQADAMFGWGDSLYRLSDEAGKAEDRLITFQGKLQTAGDTANNAAKLTVALGEAVASVPNGKDIIITENTPETIERLRALGIQVEQTPTGLKMTATTDEAEAIVNAWRQQQGLEPVDVNVVPQVDPAAKDRLDAFFNQYRNIPVGLNPNIPGVTPPAPGSPFAGPYPRAAGGPITGPGGPKSDIIPIWASNGEHMLTAKDVQAMGGQSGVYSFRNALHRSEGGAIDQGLALAASINGLPYIYGGVGPSGYDCSGAQSAVYAAFTGKPTGTRHFTTESDFEALGFQKGYMPGAYNIGVSRGGGGRLSHMGATLPNGVNFEAGGANNGVAYGDGARGAAEFPLQWYLPLGGGDPMGGTSGAGGYYTGGAGGTAGGGGGGGGTPGYGPGGESGTYSTDPNEVRDADARVAEADARVREAEAKQRELEADAKESERIRAQADVDKAKADAQSARGELEEAKRGKFTPGKAPAKGGAAAGGGLGEIGSIASSFLTETFGFGSWLPDLANLMPVKMAEAVLSTVIPMASAYAEGSWTPGGLIGDAMGTTSSAPFGIPDVAAPPMPPPGVHAGAGGLPGPVQNVTVNANQNINGSVGWGEAEADKQRRNNLARAIPRIPAGF